MTASPLLIANINTIVKDYANDDLLLIGSAVPADKLGTTKQYIEQLSSTVQLANIKPVKLAIISDLIERMDKPTATSLLGLIRHCYAGHIVLIVNSNQALLQGWQLTGFLSLGFKQLGTEIEGYSLYSYNISQYQPKHDWLNSRFWANPEQFGKHRW